LKEERLKALNEIVEEAETWRALAAGRFQSGATTQMEQLRAELYFLKVSIELEKAKIEK
jgi:outer membrane protein TolC